MSDPVLRVTAQAPFSTTWETHSDGTNYYQSPEWYRYVGEGDGSSYGEDWLRFYHPDDREYLLREWRKSIASNGDHPYNVTVRIRRHDGIYRRFRVQGAPVFTPDGAVRKWVGTCTDVHDQVELVASRPLDGGETAGRRAPWLAGVGSGKLERRLFLVVLSGLLPVALLSSAILIKNAGYQKDVVLESASDTMQAVLMAVDGELSAITATLQTLAGSPRLDHEDLAAFQVEAVKAIELRPGLVNVTLWSPGGDQLMNARVPLGQPLPASVDVESIQEVLRTGRPVVGGIVYGPVAKTQVFAVRVPVVRDNRVVSVLTAGVTPEAILQVIGRQRIPDQGVVAVFDSHKRVLARSLNHERSVGQPGSPGLVALLSIPKDSGWGLTKTLEGVTVYTVFHKSAISGWSIAVGIPAEAVDGPVLRSYLALGGSSLLSILLGVVAAALVGRGITRPMRELEQAAKALGDGRAPAVPHTDLPAVLAAGEALLAAHVEREKLLLREREARQRAEHANRAKDEFLAMLGHELRNPLNAISMSAELMQRSEDPQVLAQAKAIVSRQALHLGKLTDDLLDAGRVMLGKISLDRELIDLAQSVSEQLATLNRTGRLAHHRIERDLHPAWVYADPTRMQQVIGNLLGNAIKFTPMGGTIAVSLLREASQAVLSVRDSGVGLEPELVPRVFDLFVQGRISADREQGGLGIGLTLVRRLTELHGGSVDVRSEGRGKGSEFTVRLPVHEAPAGLTEDQAAAAPQGTCSIVIVEDNDDARITLRQLLELDGHQVREAVDGPSGIEAILQAQPDVALVDIGLPGLDGHAVAREVRRRATRPVRLIALTGYGAQIEDAESSPFDEYVVKPLDPSRLHALLATKTDTL